MTEFITTLQNEIERLEAQFLGKLAKLGADDLTKDYEDIATLRDACGVFVRRSPKPRAAKSVTANGSAVLPPLPAGFVLIDEIRKILPQIEKERFRTGDVFDLLKEEFPNVIIEERRASIGATLSNLVGAGDLQREKDDQRKIWFRVVEQEQLASAYQPAEDDDIPF